MSAWDTSGPSFLMRTATKNDRWRMSPTRHGLSMDLEASLAVSRRERSTGYNPGSIPGLSVVADRQMYTPADRARRRSK
jgi:hypothetical protein